MSSDPPLIVSPELLRRWGLPDGGDSKNDRGRVLVIGGSARAPGAAMLAGLASLRVGAGKLTLAVGRSVSTQVGVAVPECGVVPLEETADGHIIGRSVLVAVATDLGSADAVLIGPGLDDVDEARDLLAAAAGEVPLGCVAVLDAFALGALSRDHHLREPFAGQVVLTPNLEEARLLLGRDPSELAADVSEIASRFRATVSCQGVIADPHGTIWRIGRGSSGLGTSGSGDVLSGAVAGLSARGLESAPATVWASYAHAAAGDRLGARVGRLGYIASELLGELPSVLDEVSR